MNAPKTYQERSDRQSSQPSSIQERHLQNKELLHLQQNAFSPAQSYCGKSNPEQSYYAGGSYAQTNNSIYVIPHPLPSYSGHSPQTVYTNPQNSNQLEQTHLQNSTQPRQSYQQYSLEPGHLNEQYSTQPGQPYQQSPTQSGQSYQQYSLEPGHLNEQYSTRPGQRYQQSPTQPGQPYQQYPTQPGLPYQQYPIQPGQYHNQPVQQGYYVPYQQSPAPNPNAIYVNQYPVQPRSAQDSPIARPGRRPEQGEDELEGWRGFQDKDIRTVFVRKVYTIIMLQLLFTMAIVALFMFEPHVKHFVHKNRFMYYIALAIFLAIYIGMVCFQNLRRKFPLNIIALILFTLAMSYMLGTISSYHKTEAVLMAAGICAAVCLVVSIFSCFTKFDFTTCGSILCILLLVLILFGLIAIFLPSKVMTMIYAATGAIVYTLFLAYDTQMLMGGKHVEISPEEYVFAAIQIYFDIVYIFIFILMLIGANE